MNFSEDNFTGGDEEYEKARDRARRGGAPPPTFGEKKFLFDGLSLDEKSCFKAKRYEDKIDFVFGNARKTNY